LTGIVARESATWPGAGGRRRFNAWQNAENAASANVSNSQFAASWLRISGGEGRGFSIRTHAASRQETRIRTKESMAAAEA